MKPIVFAILAFFIIGIGTTSAEFYQWTDENGVTRLTDTPPPSTQEVKVFESVKSAPQIQPEEISDPSHVADEKRETEASVKEQPENEKEPYYERTYWALLKISKGLKTGTGWELYYEWIGEAGFEISRLKKAHSDWEQRNDRYESRCKELIAAYECFADASDLWRARRLNKQSEGVPKLKAIDKKYDIKPDRFLIYGMDESNPYQWKSIAEQAEQFLFKEADKHLAAYSNMN